MGSNSDAAAGFRNSAIGRPAADPTGSNIDHTHSGRRLGSKNSNTPEARAFALEIVRSPEYRKSLMDRVRAGTLASNIEAMLWAYAYGKPADKLEVKHINPTAQLAEMSVDELAERADLIAKVLREVGDVEAAEMALKMKDAADEQRKLEAIDAEIVSRSDDKKSAA